MPAPASTTDSKTITISQDEARQRIESKTPGEYKTNCPCHHPDKNPSLSISILPEGKILTNCFPCKATHADILAGLGVERHAKKKAKTLENLPAGTHYLYHDEHGEIVFAVVRNGHGKSKKIRQYRHTQNGRWDASGVSKMRAKRPLYHLPEIKDAVKTVAVVEGEKDVETILKENPAAAATCASGGAGQEKHTDWSPLAEKRVLLISDADQHGRDYMRRIAQILLMQKYHVEIYDGDGRSDGSDITDWVQEDGYRSVTESILASKQPIEPRKPYINLGDVAEEDLAIENVGQAIGREMRERVAFFSNDYWRPGSAHWERVARDDEMKAQIAMEYRPKIRKELDELGWKMKPGFDEPKFFSAYPLLWGAFNSQVSRELKPSNGSIAVANGVVDLTKNKPLLSPFDPAIHNHNTACPVPYLERPGEQNYDRWKEVKSTWFTEENEDLFFDLIARAIKNGSFRRYVTIYSPQGSGKSALVAMIERTLGELAMSPSVETLAHRGGPNEGLVTLIQKNPPLIFVNESIPMVPGGLLNAITGHDVLTARRLRKGEVSGHLTGLPIVFRERPIDIPGATEGTDMRRVVVKMRGTVPNPDKGFLDRVRRGEEDSICQCFLYEVFTRASMLPAA